VSLFDSLLNNTFTVERLSETAAGHGNFPQTYASHGTVQGRIRPASSSEKEAAAQEKRQISHVLYVAASADVARGDRVTCGELVVRVLGVRNPSLADHHLEIDCLEEQKEVKG